jgi:hypothetical protein
MEAKAVEKPEAARKRVQGEAEPQLVEISEGDNLLAPRC